MIVLRLVLGSISKGRGAGQRRYAISPLCDAAQQFSNAVQQSVTSWRRPTPSSQARYGRSVVRYSFRARMLDPAIGFSGFRRDDHREEESRTKTKKRPGAPGRFRNLEVAFLLYAAACAAEFSITCAFDALLLIAIWR